jgi:hypothetical protein
VESEWRMNVYRLGVTHLGFRLIARLQGQFNWWLTDKEYSPGLATLIRGNLLDPSSTVPLETTVIPKLTPHFPYGWNVDPD